MRFDVALNWMKQGKKMRCPGFIGYWEWDAENKTVIIVTKNNERLDIRQSPDMDFTFGFVNSDEWEFYNGHSDPRENLNWSNYQKPFGGHAVKSQQPVFPKGGI